MTTEHGSHPHDQDAAAVDEAGLVSKVYLDALRLAAENDTTPSNILFEMRLDSEQKGETRTVAVIDRAINLVTLDKSMDTHRIVRTPKERPGSEIDH